MESIQLRTGQVLSVRPIRPDDAERLAAAFQRLSPESRYLRFLAVKPRLTERDTRYLVDVDGDAHVALVATTSTTPEQIVAVARFVRLPEDPAAAEFSIVVGDDYQRAGLGQALLARLADVARAHGVVRFTATILAENDASHRLVTGFSAVAPRWEHLGIVDEVEFDLGPNLALAA